MPCTTIFPAPCPWSLNRTPARPSSSQESREQGSPSPPTKSWITSLPSAVIWTVHAGFWGGVQNPACTVHVTHMLSHCCDHICYSCAPYAPALPHIPHPAPDDPPPNETPPWSTRPPLLDDEINQWLMSAWFSTHRYSTSWLPLFSLLVTLSFLPRSSSPSFSRPEAPVLPGASNQGGDG